MKTITQSLAALSLAGILASLLPSPAWAIPVKIGNADDGRDLENLTPVTSGPIVEAKQKAIEILNRLNIAGVPGLGTLLPEVERAQLYLASEDVKPSISDDYRPDHLSNGGQVFARTMPEPYAPTRFFPIAAHLPVDRLAVLQIHEALHRSLPKQVREDESIVARLTLAITGPGATFDSVRNLAVAILPEPQDDDRITNRALMPSQVDYQMRWFFNSNNASVFAVKRAHLFQSYLYPFGGEDAPFGMGIEASIIEREHGGAMAGPLGFSARMKIFSKRDFQIDLTAGVDLNMLSSEELKNSPYGRDIGKLGVIVRKEFTDFYVENALELTSSGKTSNQIDNVSYDYSFGTVIKPSIHVGGIWNSFHVGTHLDIFLAGHSSVTGGNNDSDTGRYRLIALGPEAQYLRGNWIVGVSGRFLLNSNKDADFSNLGNVLDSWVGKGGLQMSLGYRF